MAKYEKLKKRVDIESNIIDLQMQIKYMDIDDNYDENGEFIRSEDDINAEIDVLAEKRDNLRKTLQFYCKCNYEHIRKEFDDKTEDYCSNCLKLCKVITYSSKKN
jgi:spore coat polysaccharide biosynthesis predicted glycosyltransferase SpsG